MTVLLDDGVDGEMGVDRTHLVLEALDIHVHTRIAARRGSTYLGDASDHVDDEGLNRP